MKKILLGASALAATSFIGSPTRGIVSARADASDLTKVVADIQAGFGDLSQGHVAALAAIQALTETSEAGQAKALEVAADAVKQVTVMADHMSELEQKLADGVKAGAQAPLDLGQFVVASDQFKAFASEPVAGAKMRVAASTLTGQSGGDSSNILVPEHRKPGIVPGAFRALRIADLLTTIPTTSNAYEFTKEATFTNAAAGTAEGAAKPETDITFTLESISVRTIAHWLKMSVQLLADAPAVEAYVNRRLMYGVDAKEDAQLLLGDNTGQELDGMLLAGNFTAAATPLSGSTALDNLNIAKYQVFAADYMADGIIMNPADFGAIERLKTSDAAYVVGNPFGQLTPILWGLPVVLSNNMTEGQFLMADFANSYDHVMRQSTVVQMGFDGSDFTNNLVTLRGEKRVALAILRPASAVKGALSL
jgi:HK97 family phage major capsid protein